MIVIIDYGVGNLASILNMFKKAGADAMISSDSHAIDAADRVVLPGVGAFDNAMKNLEMSGLIPALRRAALEDRKPFLGICLGMQLLGHGSEEGSLAGLGWVDARSDRFRPADARCKVPHMGWNVVTPAHTPQAEALFADVPDADGESRFYFLHSYHVRCSNRSDVMGETVHGERFTSALAHENIFAVQFHPEKSHRFGLQLLRNFASLN